MHYDVVYRFNEALDRRALITVETTLRALSGAVKDCEASGRSIESDPAILLLAHHLGDVAGSQAPDRVILEQACRRAWARTVEHPALLALRGQKLGHRLQAKTSFHFQARRALLALADALGLDPDMTRIGSRMGGAGDCGDSFLDHPDLFVTVAPWSLAADREIGFYRRRDRADAGFPMHHAPLPALLTPSALAAEIRAATGPEPWPVALAIAA
ncbi:hypothetical protein [Sphingomonas sp. SRS2]|uniref:hypothetical protein n=1 Tax=Sphingomonas sp. SRS2 TaxID=133190 RepID=UPI000697EDBD|nr:hypothetical protein [Sphingomonas sp. SRS2]